MLAIGMRNGRNIRLAAASAIIIVALSFVPSLLRLRNSDDGCRTFPVAPGPLVAHAGGGLPDKRYGNSLEALNLSARHRHRLIEMDFVEKNGVLLIGHDDDRMSDLTLAGLAAWLAAHPSIRLVTDIKTDNLSGLRQLVRVIPPGRIVPQIYQPAQYVPTRALGFRDIIFADRWHESRNWMPWVNSVPLFGVTIPKEKAQLAPKIAHQVFLYTVDVPTPGFGLYTDCLIPLR